MRREVSAIHAMVLFVSTELSFATTDANPNRSPHFSSPTQSITACARSTGSSA